MTTSKDETPVTLISKLAAVMATVERIPKRGRNEFHKYDYATEADIAATVRQELAARHVMLIPSIVGEQRHPVGEKGSVLTVLEMEMEFIDGESGESLKKPWRGYGTDKEDKGGYKAMTGGEKYFLLKTFLMPTGDDPEAHDAAPLKPVAVPTAPNGYNDWLSTLRDASMEGTPALQDAWKKSSPDLRSYLTTTNAAAWENLKAIAAKVKVSA